MSFKVQDLNAWSREQYLSKHRFLDIVDMS